MPLDLALQVLQCFDLYALYDSGPFCKCDLVIRRTPQRMQALLPVLGPYYTPCKRKLYCPETLDVYKCVTILRQVLRLHNAQVVTREGYHQKVKCVMYRVVSGVDVYPSPFSMRPTERTISFD